MTPPDQRKAPSAAELKRNLTAIAESLTVLKLQIKMKPDDADLKKSLKELEDAEALVRRTLRSLA
jgi:hypothetical protein